MDWGGFIPPQSNEKRGGTSLRRSPSSWASKPQIGFERRTLSVRRFSMPAQFSCAPPPAGRAAWRVQAFCRRQSLDWGGFIPPQSNENRGGTSLRRSPSSWASKPQIGFERRTLSVRRFSMPARSPAPASGGPRRMARTSVLPEAKPWIGADSFRPNRRKSGHPARQAGWGGTSPGRSPSSWASKPQIGFERRTLSVRRFSVTAGFVWCRGIVLDAGDVLY